MSYLMEIDNLGKRYDDFELSGVSLAVEPGCVVGFIGSNGAGKPTTSAKPVAPRPMTREYLAPHIRRDITSRPLSSVPNRCAESGAQNEVKIS